LVLARGEADVNAQTFGAGSPQAANYTALAKKDEELVQALLDQIHTDNLVLGPLRSLPDCIIEHSDRTKTSDTKPTDSKTPGAPVKDGKPQQADTPKTGQPEKTVTGKDDKPSKGTAEKQIPKGTKKLTGPETATARKTAKQAKDKPKEDKTQVHIEFFSTGGRMGGGGMGGGGMGGGGMGR
jgi:hypothetical protein